MSSSSSSSSHTSSSGYTSFGFASSSSSMSDKATQPTKKAITIHTRAEHALQNNDRNKGPWRDEILDKVHVFEDTVKQYMKAFAPSNGNIPSWSPQNNVFENVPLNRLEVDMYDPLVTGLSALTAGFPDSKKLKFRNNAENLIKFPFAQCDQDQHKTKPDIISSLPGRSDYSIARPRWRNISLACEVKRTRAQDPLGKDSVEHMDTIAQLAKSARNIMVARSSLFTFGLGIYGDTARIYRFDHSAAVVSRAFNYVEEPDLLHEFLWRFVHPMDNACTIVGDDPTVRLAGLDDRRLAEELAKTRNKCVFDDENRKACRWITVDEPDGQRTRYLVFKLLFMNPRLFSRATTVWEAFREGDSSGNTYVIKDAWRQLARHSEMAFYEALHDAVELKEMSKETGHIPGIAQLECGYDLGELEAAAYYGRAVAGPLSGTDCAQGSAAASIVAEDTEDALPPAFPYCHRTISSGVRNRETEMYNERSHMRLVMRTVGRPLSQFKTTREMVAALRDAILGHHLAYTAGVLHRDISEGNVMIADGAPFKGFISDFDYSFNWRKFLTSRGYLDNGESWKQYVETEQGIPLSADEARQVTVAIDDEKYRMRNELKERTGTLYFMAIGVLEGGIVHEAHHDLESFYWLLVWLVLRHTAHDDVEGPRACAKWFDSSTETACTSRKMMWVGKPHRISVPGNRPLSVLLEEYRNLCEFNFSYKGAAVPVTHTGVLAIFDEALNATDWPDNDPAFPYEPPRTDGVQRDPEAVVRTSQRQPTSRTTSRRPRSSVAHTRNEGLPPLYETGSQIGAEGTARKKQSKKTKARSENAREAAHLPLNSVQQGSAVAVDEGLSPLFATGSQVPAAGSMPPPAFSASGSRVENNAVRLSQATTSTGSKRSRAEPEKENRPPSKRRKSSTNAGGTLDL